MPVVRLRKLPRAKLGGTKVLDDRFWPGLARTGHPEEGRRGTKMTMTMKRFLIGIAVMILTVLTANAKAQVTALEQECPAGQTYVCYVKDSGGVPTTIVTDGHGHAVTTHEQCTNIDVTVFYGCQLLATIRAAEREECDGLGGRWYWSTTRGGRCVESRPREREDDNPPPPPPPPQNPPPPPYTPPTPPAPPGPGVTTPPGGGSTPPSPFCPDACPDCNCPVPPLGPDPCADVLGLAEELAPLEQIPAEQWIVRTDTETVRSRVFYIRERAAECAEDGLYADAERVLAAMTPTTTVTIPPGYITYQDEESCWDTWCPWVLGGAVVTVVTGVILGVICGTGGCDPTVDFVNRP